MVQGGSTNTGADGMVVVVTHSALEAAGAQESIDLLQFLGYTIKLGIDHAVYDTKYGKKPRYIIDALHPNWFGWKGAMSAITVWHYPQMQEWNMLRSAKAPVMEDLTDEPKDAILDASCFT